MPDPDSPARIIWFSPDPRGLLPLDERFHVPRRLGRTLRQGRFAVSFDRAFPAVMRGCARRKEGTWITGGFVAAYTRLHELGLAHSVESWRENALVGGLYGVALKGAFFGESMFHRRPNASKVALVALVERMRDRGFALLDVQFMTSHLAQFGARDIPRPVYLARLKAAMEIDATFID